MNSDRPVYHERIPEFLEPYLKTGQMRRLQKIDMNCGVNYTSFPLFRLIRPYTRYEHSLGVALIVWHFTQDVTQTLAGLFHDISTPVFSHVVDFMYGDHAKQEYTERNVREVIEEGEILRLLQEDGIDPDSVSDYHMYPIADNDSPRLSADRLEYSLGAAMEYGYADEEAARRMYNDLTVIRNEDGIEELAFMHRDIAEEFAVLAMKCGYVWISDEDRYAMEVLADLLKKAFGMNILGPDDLMSTEEEVIRKLEQSSLCGEWNAYTSLSRVERSETEREGWIRVDAKKRYIDPLVCGGVRVSAYSELFGNMAEEMKGRSFAYWMKGY